MVSFFGYFQYCFYVFSSGVLFMDCDCPDGLFVSVFILGDILYTRGKVDATRFFAEMAREKDRKGR